MGSDRSSDQLDEIARLRILAAGVRGTFVERTIPVGWAAVWNRAADLENELPRLIPNFRTVRIVDRTPDRLRAEVRGYLGARGEFVGTTEKGFWLMQSKHAVGGMAAIEADGGTRVAFLGAVKLPGYSVVRPLFRPLMRWQAERVLARLDARCRKAV